MARPSCIHFELTPGVKFDSTHDVDRDAFYRDLGRRVAARRSARRATQAEIGAAIGSSRASVANIEAGRQGLQVHQLYQLAQALALDDLGELIPTQVPAVEDESLLAEAGVSDVQRAQIESIVRNAVASARPKGRRR